MINFVERVREHFISYNWEDPDYNGRTKDRVNPQLDGSSTYIGREDFSGITGNMVPVNSGFHTRMNFCENYPQLGHAPSKEFTGEVLRMSF